MTKRLTVIITFMMILVSSFALADSLPTITVFTAKVDTRNFDGAKVAQALDQYVSEKIGIHVNLEFIEYEHYSFLLNKFHDSEYIPDAFLSTDPEMLYQLHKADKLLPLDTLLEQHGQGILACVDPEYLEIQSDSPYAIPCLIDRAVCLCFVYRKNIADQYHLNISAVRTIEDLTSIFDQLHEQDPSIIPLDIYYDQTYDALDDRLGVLLNFGQDRIVKNLFTSEEYAARCRLISEWSSKGYLLNTDSGWIANNSFFRTPKLFGRLSKYNPDMECTYSISAGEPIACQILSDSYVYTDTIMDYAWSISKASNHPVEAMQSLNLMYTDPNVMNLLCYGLEGVHYEVIDPENGIIDIPQALDTTTSSYAPFRNYYYGNEFITYLWNGYPLDLWEQIQSFNTHAKRSIALGFHYDPTSVLEQVYACSEIVQAYTPLLDAGIGETDHLLEEFCHKLEESGIDAIIEEKQRQLNAFLKEKEARSNED